MGDKILLNYKGNLDVSDIPGALTGSKSGILSRIQGRDYINVHDIPGAIPKINVGYTGNYRLDEQGIRGSPGQNISPSQNQDLIGRPKLKSNNTLRLIDEQLAQGNQWNSYNNLMPYQINQQSHQRGGSVQMLPKRAEYVHSNYNAINAQQVDHNQIYNTFRGNKDVQQNSPFSRDNQQNLQSSSSMERRDQFSQNSINDRVNQEINQILQQENIQKQKPQNKVRYEDALDKFMTQSSSDKIDIHSLLKREKQNLDSKLNQYKTSVPMNNQNSGLTDKTASSTGDYQLFNQPLSQQSGLLTSRNSAVAKSTANLILKPKQDDDLFATLGQRTSRYHQQPKQAETHQREQSQTLEGSPAQVQKKIKEMQSAMTDQNHTGGLHNSTHYLDQVNALKSNENPNQTLKNKSHGLFRINPSTIPDDGKFDIRHSQGAIKRSLNLAPSTQLGQHHKEEIDDSIQKREYTKLGGGNLSIQMPSEINNISYHKHNSMKDYTYSALTGSYYYKAPN